MPIRYRAAALVGMLGALLIAGTAPAMAQQDEPLPRFEDAMCPGIVGLKVEAAESMVGRIRANAAEFGVRLADERVCEPNVIVAFVEDGGEFLANLQGTRGFLFTEMDRTDREALLAEPGPARVLSRVRARSRDGMTIPRRENLSQVPESTMWMAHSKIYTATRNDITWVLVLFDRAAVGALTTDQLADYTTFRALSAHLPPPSARSDSILTLFDTGEGERPAALSAFDRAWLATLYQGVPNIPASARLAALEKATGRALQAE